MPEEITQNIESCVVCGDPIQKGTDPALCDDPLCDETYNYNIEDDPAYKEASSV